jgi:hypothetical protein
MLASGRQDFGANMADYAASFCERCGTRYTFGSASSAGAPLRDAKVLAKGLKYFVTSNSGSIGEAMAYARMDEHSRESSRVTQQFHKTFNFCMTCRQYACDNCWNSAQGACLTCAPEGGIEPVEPTDLLLVRTPVSRPEQGPAASTPGLPDLLGSTYARPAMPAWPVQDLPMAEARPGLEDTTVEAAAESSRLESRSLWPIQDDLDGERMDLTPEELTLVEGQLEHMAPHALADSIFESVAVEEPVTPEEPVTVAEVEEPAMVADLEEFVSTLVDVSPVLGPIDVGTASTPLRESAVVAGPWPDATPWSTRTIQSGVHVLGLVSAEPTVPAAETPAEPLTAAVVPPDELALGIEATIEPELIAEPEVVAEPEIVAAREFVPEPAVAAEPESAPQPELAALPEWQFDDVWPLQAAATSPAHDWSAPAEQLPESASEPVSDVTGEVPYIEPRPSEPIAAIPPVQQPLFEMPAVSADRWAATARPTEPDARRHAGGRPAPWQPLGASWPTPDAPDAPWPGPEPSAVPAAIVAAQQAAQLVGPAIWATSSQQVMSRGNVRACHHCALPVSTHARFCRRCGTEQA